MTVRNPLVHNNGHTAELPTGDTIKPENMPEVTTTARGVVPATGTPAGRFLKDDVTWAALTGAGDVIGPVSSTNNALVLWDGTGGDTLKDGSGVAVDILSKNTTLLAADSSFNAGTLTLDMATGNVFQYTLNATDGAVTALAISNPPVAGSFGNLGELLLTIIQGSASVYTFAWTNIIWNGGAAPNVAVVGSKVIVRLWTVDAGITWYGRVLYLFVNCMPNDANTKLLIHSDTTDNSTVIDDSSNSNITLVANGTASHKTTQSKFGKTSIYLDGAGNHITATTSALNLGSGSYTLECWVYNSNWITGAYQGILTTMNLNPPRDGYTIRCNPSGKLQVWTTKVGGTDSYIESVDTLTNDLWQHVAAVNNNGTLKIYFDGVEQASGVQNPVGDSGNFAIGRGYLASDTAPATTCYIDEIRISIGMARWTTGFIPPGGPYCDE